MLTNYVNHLITKQFKLRYNKFGLNAFEDVDKTLKNGTTIWLISILSNYHENIDTSIILSNITNISINKLRI